MSKRFFIFIFIFSLIFFNFRSTYAVNCLTINSNSSQSDKDFCQNELKQIEKELAELIKKQEAQKKNTGTLQGDVNYLNSQINALKTKVKARSLAIAQLKVSINEKVSKIESLEDKIEHQHQNLAQLLRNTNNFDDENIIHLIFSTKNLSEFYDDLHSYASLKEAIKESVDEIRGIKTNTESEKKELEKKQNAELDAKVELENAQKKTAQSEAEKKKLLSISKNKEVEYKKLAEEKKARADKIRAALFPLRDSKAIPFGEALSYAEKASKTTGVRPAFVLAILQQESNMGANVGSCIISDLTTGQTKGVNSGTIFSNGIHPTRDLPTLQSIVKALGRDPLSTRVSCPIGKIGYGGAMGPAQFIPSTWNVVKSKVASILGKSTVDPWDPEDAITASSVLLQGNGASGGSYTAERTAALKYYAGGNWNKPANAFYGNQVMARVAKIQADIDLLSY